MIHVHFPRSDWFSARIHSWVIRRQIKLIGFMSKIFWLGSTHSAHFFISSPKEEERTHSKSNFREAFGALNTIIR